MRLASRCVLPCLLAASVLATASVGVAEDASTGWLTDFERAEALAEERNVPLLVHFHASWCGPCRVMERTVLGTDDVKKRLGESVVGVKVDADRSRDLVKRWDVRALPTDLLIDPNGRELSRTEGAKPAFTYLSWVDRTRSRFDDAQRVNVASSRGPDEAEADLVAESKDGSAAKSRGADDADAPMPKIVPRETAVAETEPEAEPGAASEDVRLGLSGYSPVALYRSREWVRGSEEFAVEHEGLTYRLASEEERAAFESNPRRYAPQLLGCDPVRLYEADRAVAGDPRYGAYFDERLYLFESDETRARFRRKPYRFTRTQHVLRADQIGTRLR